MLRSIENPGTRDWAPFDERFALCYQTLVCLSVCLSVTLVYCGQTVGWIRMKPGVQIGLGPGHIVLDGDPAPPPPKGHSPQFSAHICCGQLAGWIKMPLCTEVGLGSGDFVLHGDPSAPFPQKVTVPQFSAHVYCGQTAGWIKVALGMEVGLGPGNIVLDGEPAPLPQIGGRAPRFSAHLLSPNGSMDEDATWYGSRPRPHCIRRGPSSARNEHSSFPSFRPVSMVATVAHLSYC